MARLETVMKCYRSFLIRCWLIEDPQQVEKKVIDVEHIQSGDHTRVADMAEAEEWMFAVTRRGSTESEAARIGRESGIEEGEDLPA